MFLNFNLLLSKGNSFIGNSPIVEELQFNQTVYLKHIHRTFLAPNDSYSSCTVDNELLKWNQFTDLEDFQVTALRLSRRTVNKKETFLKSN